MQITFFQNSSSNNTVNKQLSHLAYGNNNIVTADVVKPCSFNRPSFILGTANFNFNNCNYLFCDVFNRYYYVDDVILLKNGMTQLNCHVDVLRSFMPQILNLYTTIERQEQVENCNPFIEDNLAVSRVDRQYVKKELPNKVGGNATGHHITLTVTGGI